MSYLERMKEVLSENTPIRGTDRTDRSVIFIKQPSAELEFSGKLEQENATPAGGPANWLDALLSRRRPEGEPPARWNQRCAGVRRFVDDGWHQKAGALGWSHDELFGRGTEKVRGAAWHIRDDRVLFVTGDQIMACSKSGLAQPIYRGVYYSGQESGK